MTVVCFWSFGCYQLTKIWSTQLLHEDPLPPLPYELQNVYSTEMWTSRIQTATQACRKWARPTAERLYFFFAFL